MNVLFVASKKDSPFPRIPLANQTDIHLGLSYLSAHLQRHGHRTRLLALNRLNRNLAQRVVRNFRPQLICFTAVASEYPFIAQVARSIKKRTPDVFLIAGGVHVTLNPRTCINDGFDALCVGEGEAPLLELVQQLEKGQTPTGIQNLWFRHGLETEENPTRPFIQDLDDLAFPDRQMWQEWIKYPASRSSILLGRGCPFNCTYCCNPALREIASGRYVRFRSPENIIREVEHVADRFRDVNEIYLEVETIGVKKDWAISLCDRLEHFNRSRRVPIGFGANLRITPKADFEELFAAMKRANITSLSVGLESGSERVRREILHRIYSNDDVVRTVELARKYHLRVGFYNMIGLPGETIDDFRQTVEVNRTCQPDWHSAYIFFPYPGTALHTLCREKGLLTGPLDMTNERYKPVLDLPGFSKRQIQTASTWFSYYVHKGHMPLHKILHRVFLTRILSNYSLARLYSLTDFGILKRLRRLLKAAQS